MGLLYLSGSDISEVSQHAQQPPNFCFESMLNETVAFSYAGSATEISAQTAAQVKSLLYWTYFRPKRLCSFPKFEGPSHGSKFFRMSSKYHIVSSITTPEGL